MSRARSRWRKAALQLLAAAAVLLAIEGALRLFGYGPAGDDPYAGFTSGLPLFVEDGMGGMVTAPDKRPWFNVQRFPADKPPLTTRIFSLGGSTTYGHPYDDRVSISGWLREYLAAAAPERRWEVINAGGISYGSDRIALLMAELLRYEPDVFIVEAGHNEFLEAHTYPGLADRPGWLLAFGALLSRTALFNALRPASSRPLSEVRTTLEEVGGLDSYLRDDAQHAAVLARFSANLQRMRRMAEGAGARLILISPASELRDCVPFKSDPDPDDPRHALAHYRRAEELHARGDLPAARAAYVAARDEDLCPLRAPSDFVAAVRQAGAELVDFGSMVGELPGAETFLDHVHPRLEVTGRLARALLQRLLPELPPSWDDPQVASTVLASLRPDDHIIALRNLAKVLGWAGKTQEAARLAAEVLERSGGGDAESHFLLGVFAMNEGRLEEAAGHYRDALDVDPGYAEAAYNLADVLSRSGQTEQAVAEFRRAIRLDPDRVSAYNNAGLLLTTLDRPEEARELLEQAIVRDPSYALAHNNLGLALAALGRVRDAEASFRRAAELDETYAKARYNLGVLLAAQKRDEEAREALAEALAIDPDYAAARDKLAGLGSP